jgi:hypothetical protein
MKQIRSLEFRQPSLMDSYCFKLLLCSLTNEAGGFETHQIQLVRRQAQNIFDRSKAIGLWTRVSHAHSFQCELERSRIAHREWARRMIRSFI